MALDYCLRISGRCATSRTSMREFSFLGSQRTLPSSNFQFVYLSHETDLSYRFPCFFTTLVRQILNKAEPMKLPCAVFSASKNLEFCHRFSSRNLGVTPATRHFYFSSHGHATHTAYPAHPVARLSSNSLPGNDEEFPDHITSPANQSGSFKVTLATRQ